MIDQCPLQFLANSCSSLRMYSRYLCCLSWLPKHPTHGTTTALVMLWIFYYSLGSYLQTACTHHIQGWEHISWSTKDTEISHYCRLPENPPPSFRPSLPPSPPLSFLKLKGSGSLLNETFKIITFGSHNRTRSLKNLCSFICKRSLPEFSQNAMAQMSQKSPCSLGMSFQNQSSTMSIYTSSPQHSEKDTTVIASFPTWGPVCAKDERSGKKGLWLTKLSWFRSQFKCYTRHRPVNQPWLFYAWKQNLKVSRNWPCISPPQCDTILSSWEPSCKLF